MEKSRRANAKVFGNLKIANEKKCAGEDETKSKCGKCWKSWKLENWKVKNFPCEHDGKYLRNPHTQFHPHHHPQEDEEEDAGEEDDNGDRVVIISSFIATSPAATSTSSSASRRFGPAAPASRASYQQNSPPSLVVAKWQLILRTATITVSSHLFPATHCYRRLCVYRCDGNKTKEVDDDGRRGERGERNDDNELNEEDTQANNGVRKPIKKSLCEKHAEII